MAAPLKMEATVLQPPAHLQDSPIKNWKREEILKYALYIKEQMSTFKASAYEIDGIFLFTRPLPNASIKIVDAVSKEILFQDPAPGDPQDLL